MSILPNPALIEARKLDGVRKRALETGRNRLLVTGVVLAMAFTVMAGRLVDLTVLTTAEPIAARAVDGRAVVATRGQIADRNGIILATSLPTASLFADPVRILDREAAASQISAALVGESREEILAKLSTEGRFVWLARNLTPRQQYEIHRLGIPGLGFQTGERRVYPHGRLAAHVLGLTDVDGRGLSGIEQHFDTALTTGSQPLRLSLDLRVQAILHQELTAVVEEFKALGATGIVLDANTGEVLAMVSLPDFDPNAARRVHGEAGFNRATKGVYEMGSTFKLFTAAMALDTGAIDLKGGYDASQPIRVARFTINDYHAENRWLSVPEIILHSSNIGAAKMAMDVGTQGQRDYLGRFGLLRPARLELPELGSPLTPATWRSINTMTISYGHGIAVSPMNLVNGIAALVNGGEFRQATLLKRQGAAPRGKRVISAKTSKQLRGLMRLVVAKGTGRKADVPGYDVGGKTGTADKQRGRGYAKSARISSFVGAFPMSDPRYVVLALVDEPKGNKRTFNYATGGWVGAPVVKRVVERIAPMLGILPDPDVELEAPVRPVIKAAAATVPMAALPIRHAVDRQTDDEARMVRETRHSLDRALTAQRLRHRTVHAARAALEQELAAR